MPLESGRDKDIVGVWNRTSGSLRWNSLKEVSVVTKAIGIILLGILSISVLLGIVIPSLAFALGLGVEIPSSWVRHQKVLSLYGHPWLLLLAGILLLFLLVWGIWRLARA